MTTNSIFIWLKDFQFQWLPDKISNDQNLLELITNKVNELEQLLIQKFQENNEIIYQDKFQRLSSNNINEMSHSKSSDRSLPTPPNVENQTDDEENEIFSRPIIRLKRIPLTEAERFVPNVWKTSKLKGARKKHRKKSLTLNSSRKKSKRNIQISCDEIVNRSNITSKSTRAKNTIEHVSTSSIQSAQSTNDEKKKNKRKLRAIDAEDDDLFTLGNLSQTTNSTVDHNCEKVSRYIGQNGILSQTRKTNETTTTLIDENDFTIKLPSRQTNSKDETIKRNHSNDVDISGTITIVEDVGPIDDEQIFKNVIENNDNESLFASLEITHEKTFQTSSSLNNNYDDCIEDITNDGIDPPVTSSNLDHIVI